jgi:DNA polymerase-3 subunit delta
MKLTFKQIEPFVKNPDRAARVILVYGPDQGLMNERAKTIAQTAVSDLNDPFNVVTLSCDKIMDDPSSFYDEANAQSLMGGDRLIIIKAATDALNVILKDYLENPSMETLVVVESGDLGPRSALRKVCEASKSAAAVPCYVDDERNLAQIIRDMCMHAGYGIAPDAIAAFSSALVGDRIIARGEIEKLLLYKGLANGYAGFEGEPIRERIGQITLNDIYASCGDVRDWSMDKLVYAIGDGDPQTTHCIVQSLFNDQIPSIVMLRSVQNHFWRLLNVQAKMAEGLKQGEAIKTLTPPLFWKVEDAFKRQLNRWPIGILESALDKLNQIESMCKKTGYVDTSLVEHAFVQLARYNPRAFKRVG